VPQQWDCGAWTYRSYFNRPDPVEKVDDILLAEAEMVFETAPAGEIRGQLAFRSDRPNESDPRLAFSGSVASGSPGTARFRGTGVPGTKAEGWVYDYVGFLVPNWPSEHGQRTAVVGSVIRVLDHAGSDGSVHRAGEVFSFIAVHRDFPEPKTIIPIASPVLEMLASRHHRLHHLVWHTVRNSWNDDLLIPADKKEVIGRLGWAPPRPVLSSQGDPLFGNASGEDFLFMHRQMVIEVNERLRQAGYPPIAPWPTVPAPEPVNVEPDFSSQSPAFSVPGNPRGLSVPPTWYSSDEVLNHRLESLKCDDYYWSRMRWWDRQYKDPAYLSTLTLGELGTLIEWTIHNDMHMRWAAVPRDPITNEPLPEGRQDWDIDTRWDNPNYDHLGEQYSSHVNPVFWRLHGWVDARIEDWFSAHEVAHPGEIERVVVMGTPWFRGKWVQVDMPWPGPMHMADHQGMRTSENRGDDMEDEIHKMEQVIHLLFPPPGEADLAAEQRGRPVGRRRVRRSHF
jgi:hypothetical protein